MNILRPTFYILAACGYWRPTSWSTKVKKVLYTFYTIFMFLLIYSFCASQFLYLVLNVETADEFSEAIYMFFAAFMACCKIAMFLTYHDSIKMMINRLEEKPCKPMNTAEATIQREHDKKIGSVTICYAILVKCSVLFIIISSFFLNVPKRQLVYKAWLPFNYSNHSNYFIAYVHQMIAVTGLAFTNVSCDSFVIGLCAHACSQQEILKHRLKEATRETSPEFGTIVRFHNYLYRYAFMIQEEFKVMLTSQLLTSTLVVCFIMYQMSVTSPYNPKFLGFVIYMACMMTQIFMYCWFGNELKLKSVELADTIFHLDWTHLDKNAKNSLLFIMFRAMNPIELTCAYVITMDVDTFVGILKMSYSTYNLLQRSR